MSAIKTDRESLIHQVRKSFSLLFEVISKLDQDSINRPVQDGWSIGQILEHIIKSQVGMIRVLRGPSLMTSRKTDEKVELFQTNLGNDDLRFPAAGVLHPDDEPKDLERMVAKFRSNQKAIEFQVTETDMEKEFTSFNHPQLGTLTGVEWVYFEQSHTGRHLRKIFRLI